MLRRILASLLPLTLLVSCGVELRQGSSFPVQYLVQTPAYDAVADCTRYANLSVADARQARSVVGKRYGEDYPDQVYPISITGDLSTAVAAGAQTAFDKALVRQGNASNADIKLNVVSLSMEERSKFNSVFTAAMVLDVLVIDRRSQGIAWQSRKTGHGSNYGKRGSSVNYQETFSRSLDDALKQMVGDPEFSRATCSLNASGSAP